MQHRSPRQDSEAERLAALDSYNILDTPRERDFDEVAELASEICETPIAVVNLIGEGRQFFKAEVGLGVRETPLESSFCAKAILEEDFLVVPDATQDVRFDCNPLVTGEPGLRFYAGALLKTQAGFAIGTVCVLDFKPRELTPLQEKAMRVLAHQVMKQLELRRALRDRDALMDMQAHAENRRNGLLLLGDRLRDARTVGEMTRAASAVVGQILKASRAAFGRLDEAQDYITVEPDWTREGVASIAGRYRLADYGGNLRGGLMRGEALVVEDVLTDPRTEDNPQPFLGYNVRTLVNIPVREQGRTIAAFIIHDDKPRQWKPEVLTFLHNVADRVEVGVARLNAEERQRTLNEELSHRMKNTFAMIQAIATQTLRPVSDREPVETFNQRLHALSSAHDLLLRRNWSSSRMDGVAAAVIAGLADLGRFDITGPEILLGPRATLSISLLLHELTTNAVKYGALSNEVGRVRLDWRTVDSEEGPMFGLDWSERDGPAAVAPRRKGFGSRLIRMGLIGTGDAELHYTQLGLQAEFKAPLARVQSS